MIIGLGYKKRSGKSEIAKYLAERYGFRVCPFAARIYSAAEGILGEPVTEFDKNRMVYGEVTGRLLLQAIGDFGKQLFGERYRVAE